jgi:hypothetical protein
MLLKDRLRILRGDMSKAELSRRTNGYVSASYIKAIEDGADPDITKVISLSGALGMHVSEFVNPLHDYIDKSAFMRAGGELNGVPIEITVRNLS